MNIPEANTFHLWERCLHAMNDNAVCHETVVSVSRASNASAGPYSKGRTA